MPVGELAGNYLLVKRGMAVTFRFSLIQVLDQRAAEERASMSMKQSFQNFEKEQKRKKEIKEIKKYKKLRAREMKNSLEEVPKTYVIDQEAFAKKHTPDFEKDWRPVRPRMPGLL